MSNDSIDINQIRHLVPLNVLNETNLANLLNHAEMKQAKGARFCSSPASWTSARCT